jgi:drug/metabolite transporter (DMT)-like permease
MHKTKPLDLFAVTAMLVLCLSWAFQQIAIKFAVPELGGLAQGMVRSVGSTLLIGIFLIARRRSMTWMSGLTIPGVLSGLLFGAEFILLFLALVYTDASRAVMFLYAAPFVVAIGSHFMFPGEQLDLKSTIGVILAFTGVAITLQPSPTAGGGQWIGDLMALGAGVLWGLTTLVIKGSRLRFGPASQVLFYQLGVSAVMFCIACWITGESPFVPVSGLTVASLLYQTVWVATITFGIWFALITTYSATSLSVITFITPVSGAFLGHLILDEPLGLRHMLAVFAVALGILLVTLPRNRAARRQMN